MMNNPENNGWDSVKGAACSFFDGFWVESELKWAKEAWGHMHAAGLIDEDSIVGWTASQMRLLTLARIYEEFAGAAWDDDPETSLGYWAEDLALDPMALGILAARIEPDSFEGIADPDEMMDNALEVIVSDMRREIHRCLLDAHGGESTLYIRMARIRIDPENYDRADELDITYNNCAAYEYVSNGFYKS